MFGCIIRCHFKKIVLQLKDRTRELRNMIVAAFMSGARFTQFHGIHVFLSTPFHIQERNNSLVICCPNYPDDVSVC